ncbi:hypothetical protein PI20285_09990 [Pediococcus inopinatus]|nr:hypothetical protein PI20285_09990 [Pediococcus inopinatus]
MNPYVLIRIVGVFIVLIGLIQFYVVYKQWKKLRVSMNANTSGWMALSFWSSLWFGVGFIMIGLTLIFYFR